MQEDLSEKDKEEDDSTENNDKRELRGLFTLGLLAVLITVRTRFDNLTLTVGQYSFDFLLYISILITTWSAYAFFMVFGLSEDMIGVNLARVFQTISITFLGVSFIFTVIFGGIYFTFIFYPQSLWVIILVGSFAISGYIIRLLTNRPKPVLTWKITNITKLDLLKESSMYITIISAVVLLFDPLFIFFALGLGFSILFRLIKEGILNKDTLANLKNIKLKNKK